MIGLSCVGSIQALGDVDEFDRDADALSAALLMHQAGLSAVGFDGKDDRGQTPIKIGHVIAPILQGRPAGLCPRFVHSACQL
jgi:hypothetical protein